MFKLKNFIISAFILSVIISAGCSGNKSDPGEKKDTRKEKSEKNSEADVDLIPVTVRNILGKWNLIYTDNYGYSFIFYKNFQSLITIHLKSSSIVFKGVFTIEENSRIRVNIYEMKNEESLHKINLNSGFTKTQKSFFVFKGNIREKGGKKHLLVIPERIIIDGTNSDGYFEPLIKLE